jgi:hypothetical protein
MSAEYKRSWYIKNRERILKKAKSRYIKKGRKPKTVKSSIEYITEYRKNYRHKNKQKISEYYKTKMKCPIALKAKAAREAKRRSIKLNACVKWADLNKIKNIYLNCPAGYHVDHIIPLQGKNVCGLHIENNLQYLPAIENFKKHNKFEVHYE